MNLVDGVRAVLSAAADRLPTPVVWRSWWSRRRGAAFDRLYGTDTQTHAAVTSLGLDPSVARHAVHYEPSSLPKIERVLRRLPIRHEQYCFVDIGSGKGLASLIATRYPFRRIVGVEASNMLYRIAEKNLVLYAGRATLRAPVEFVNLNALDYRLPDEPVVVYMYNPFDETVLMPLIADLLARPAGSDYVAYVNPVHRAAFDAAFVCVFDDSSIAIYRRKLA